MRFGDAGVDILDEATCQPRLGMCPLHGGYGAAAVVIAAAGAPYCALVRFHRRQTVAFVRRADTAGMGWRSRRHLREGNEDPDKREQ